MEDSSLFSWQFHISGQVQGVGFRPHVYRIARRFQIKGSVSNDIQGVNIKFTSTTKIATRFVSEIVDTAPRLARISNSQLKKIEFKKFDAFTIIQLASTSSTNIAITPDLALCSDCKTDLKVSRRKNYPFTSCTQCGPRYSILQKLPFERHHTTLQKFDLCSTCLGEYSNQTDRRFYAQTMSCPTCEICLQLYNKDNSLISTDSAEILSLANSFWNEGKIIAIKGVGGFLLTCAANQGKTVQELRLRKQRPTKPFAIMLPSIDYYPNLKPSIHKALTSHASPIVLCSKKNIPNELESVADKFDRLGIMIPYSALFQLLLQSFNQPIIATSANVTNSPLAYKNDEALKELSSIADFILTHNRDIVMPQDDSVITFTEQLNQKIILRRSRGMAPNYLKGYHDEGDKSILCLGAEIKSTFCISHQSNIFISQYLGHLTNFETQKRYSYALEHFMNLISTKPDQICVDAHPEFFTKQKAIEIAQKLDIPIATIQHHKAHFAAILGEHKLLKSKDRILGIVWDGTGLGDDGMIWGSEFFVYQSYTMTRCSHLEYYPHFLKDKMAKEPRISALAILEVEEIHTDLLKKKFTSEEWRIYNTLMTKELPLKTSSMGRLFDAAASILSLIDIQSFEGEAAMLLEVVARRFVSTSGIDKLHLYNENSGPNQFVSAKGILLKMIEDLQAQQSIGFIAASFHLTLVQWIIDVAKKEECTSLAFSGGVFQNGLLVDLIHIICEDDYTLYFHQDLSPNDENISYGQYIYFKMTEKLVEKN